MQTNAHNQTRHTSVNMEQTQCVCYYDALLLNPFKTHNNKTIQKAHKRILDIINRSDLATTLKETASTLLTKAESKLIDKSQTNEQHNCKELTEILTTIKEATKKKPPSANKQNKGPTKTVETTTESTAHNGNHNQEGDSLSNTTDNTTTNTSAHSSHDITGNEGAAPKTAIEVESVAGHFYKNKVARFRCHTKDYDLIKIKSVEEMMEWMGPLREYLATLHVRSIDTLTDRHPIVLQALKKRKTLHIPQPLAETHDTIKSK